jgi:hypothetical protein
MSAGDTLQVPEAIGLLQFGDCTGVPKDAFSVPVAWPATAWRVLVPAPRRTGSDPLQRAVLRLIAAGCVDPRAIGSWLDVPPDLVRVLLELYRSEKFLEQTEPTALSDSGRRLLKQDDEITFSDESHRSAWVLRDEWSGDIIPFLIEDDLRWCSREGRSEFTVLGGERLAADRPRPLRIREALSQYRAYVNQIRDCQRTNDIGETCAAPEETAQDGTEAACRDIPGIVQLLWQCSERVYIPMRLYFTADDPRVRQIATGFSLPPIDGWFASKLAWASGRMPELQHQIEAWMGKAVEIFPPRPTLDETDSRAVREFPFFANSLELNDTRKWLARAYRAAALYEENDENIDVYVTRCYLTLEALLTACLSNCGDAALASKLVRGDDFENQLSDIANRLNVELPRGFCSRHYAEKAKSAAKGRGESLKDRAIALMFCAIHNRRSPARDAFTKNRELLVHIDTVTRYRNTRGSHYQPSAELGDQHAMATQVARSTRYVVGVLGKAFFGDRQNGKETQSK